MNRVSNKRQAAGFTLIELMAVVAIVGILAALAVTAYTKNVRNARRTEVLADLSNLSLRERAAFNVHGHYISTTDDENDLYPVAPNQLVNFKREIAWGTNDPGYHRDGVADGQLYFTGGGDEHGFDAMNFMPEGANSYCTYGAIAGVGSSAANPEVPPVAGLGLEVFPANIRPRYANRDWFYAVAKCDFDRDGIFWEFTTAHFTSDVTDGGVNVGE